MHPINPPGHPSRLAWRLLFWALVVAVSVLMLVPRPPPSLDTGWDKLNHLLAFAATSFAGMAARHRHRSAWAPALWAGLLAWGGALELLQGLLPPRSADPLDALADAAGIALGAVLFALSTRWARSARRE